MLINGLDIATFKAKQLNADVQPSTINLSGEWVNKSLLPTFLGKSITFKPIRVVLVIQDDTKDKVDFNISNIISKFVEDGLSELKLDGYANRYKCFLVGSNIEKTVDSCVKKLNLDFQGYEISDEIIEMMNQVVSKNINALGNSNTPAIVEITPIIDTIDITINGMSDDPIIIKNLKQGQKVIIDGELGNVLENGINKFTDTDMWEFPRLKPGLNNVTLSKNTCNVNIKYKPIWL